MRNNNSCFVGGHVQSVRPGRVCHVWSMEGGSVGSAACVGLMLFPILCLAPPSSLHSLSRSADNDQL